MITHRFAGNARFSPGKVAVHRVSPGVWAASYAADPADPFAMLRYPDYVAGLLSPPTEQIRFARTYRGAWSHADQIARTLPRR